MQSDKNLNRINFHEEIFRFTKTPKLAIFLGWLMIISFLILPFVLLMVPWQQTVKGRGQIVAFAPTERKRVITARVTGQISKWHVVEGSKVKVGDPIADIDDNDVGLSSRLESQRDFLLSRRKAAEEEVAEQGRTVQAQERSMNAAIRAAKANYDAALLQIDVAKESGKNSDFAYGFEKRRYEMFEKLYKDRQFGGLESELNRDEAKMRADRSATELKRAEVEVKKAEATLINNDALVFQAEATWLSNIAVTRANKSKAEQNIFTIEREIQEIDCRIERFKARFVKSPCNGIIHTVTANVGEGGIYVKEGDELAIIVPDTSDRVVEILIDGTDAPLVASHIMENGKGPHVRLQFEGWPALQMAGWPSLAIGTFGGRVRQLDPSDDGYGRFRIIVEPESMFDEDQWPENTYLRQGNQVVGWVFLNKVKLGYELWRQFNGFPPELMPKPDENKDKAKPPKVKA
jgi:multidrug efflux pump subunit AcrA (membrane-fusion protein)